MHTSGAAELVRRYFSAYESQDRKAMEDLLGEDFTFTSPIDDHIDRARYFERCWPYSQISRRFRILNLVETDNEALVRYQCEFEGQGGFRSTEYFRIEGNKIREVCVYFGGDLAPAAGTATREAQIRALIEGWIAAVRAKDIDARMANNAPDLVSFDAAGPLRRIGSEAVRERLRRWLDSYERPIDCEIRELSITAGDEMAFGHGLLRFNATRTDGRKVELWVRETYCFRNVHGKWLATHTHASVPFDEENGQASLDLQP